MKQKILVSILCMSVTVANGKEPSANSYSGSGVLLDFGFRTLSFQSLNVALKKEGLPELKPVAFQGSIGFSPWDKPFVFNGKLTHFSKLNEDDDSNFTEFKGFGVSFDFGLPIWNNDHSTVYPFVTLSYFFSILKTHQSTNDVSSFSAAFQQQAGGRSFSNSGELGAALGLAYRIGTLEFRGGYNFTLLHTKWYYSSEENKIEDFPKMDCRGWVFGISVFLGSEKNNKIK